MTDSDQPIITASVIGAVVDRMGPVRLRDLRGRAPDDVLLERLA